MFLAEMAARPAEGFDSAERWLTVTDAARAAAVEKYQITRAVDTEKLRGNGLTSTKRRIDAIDLVRWILARCQEQEEPETNEKVQVDATDFRADYLAELRSFCDRFRQECLQCGIDYVPLDTSM